MGERGVRFQVASGSASASHARSISSASVLVLDEATSALDNTTERSVMEAIEALDRELTILLIAHRLTTVRRCDTIIELGRGRVVAQAPYESCSNAARASARWLRRTASV